MPLSPQVQQTNVYNQPTANQYSNSQWLTNFDAALAQAQQQGRPLVALLVHRGCPACDSQDAILAQPGAMQTFDNAVKVRIEFTHNPDIVHRLGLKLTPTLLVFSPTTRGEVFREVGPISADRLRQLKPTIDSLVAAPSPQPTGRQTASTQTRR
jgi:hypothetical protein